MYGFCRLGTMPAPSAGAAEVAKGLETKQSISAKKTAMPPSTGTVHAMSSRVRRFSSTASDAYPVSTSSQRRSDPSWPPQNAESAYPSGSDRLVCCAT